MVAQLAELLVRSPDKRCGIHVVSLTYTHGGMAQVVAELQGCLLPDWLLGNLQPAPSVTRLRPYLQPLEQSPAGTMTAYARVSHAGLFADVGDAGVCVRLQVFQGEPRPGPPGRPSVEYLVCSQVDVFTQRSVDAFLASPHVASGEVEPRRGTTVDTLLQAYNEHLETVVRYRADASVGGRAAGDENCQTFVDGVVQRLTGHQHVISRLIARQPNHAVASASNVVRAARGDFGGGGRVERAAGVGVTAPQPGSGRGSLAQFADDVATTAAPSVPSLAAGGGVEGSALAQYADDMTQLQTVAPVGPVAPLPRAAPPQSLGGVTGGALAQNGDDIVAAARTVAPASQTPAAAAAGSRVQAPPATAYVLNGADDLAGNVAPAVPTVQVRACSPEAGKGENSKMKEGTVRKMIHQ